MTQADITSYLFAVADALGVPHRVATLAFASLCVWALYKWGAPILLACALVYFCIGRGSDAVAALLITCALLFVRASVQILERWTSSPARNRTA